MVILVGGVGAATATVAIAEEAAELLPPKAEIARRRHGRQYGQIASGHKSACNFIASRRTAYPLILGRRTQAECAKPRDAPVSVPVQRDPQCD
jgi:hypothetical protein